MGSIARGRGINRSNPAILRNPGLPSAISFPSSVCENLYKAINEINIKKIEEALLLLSKEDEKSRETTMKFLISLLYKHNNFCICFMRSYDSFVKYIHENISSPRFRVLLISDLQQQYDSVEIFTTKDQNFRRNYLILIVTVFMSRSHGNLGYTFLVQPIISLFELLLNTYEFDNIELVAILYLKCWVHLKNTHDKEFNAFLVFLRTALVNDEVRSDGRQIILFLLDVTNSRGAQTFFTKPLCEYYQNHLYVTTIQKFCEWTDNEFIKSILDENKHDTIEKSSSDNQISDKTENAPEDIQKQAVPRAIRGSGATDSTLILRINLNE